jgi:hypothetical protein
MYVNKKKSSTFYLFLPINSLYQHLQSYLLSMYFSTLEFQMNGETQSFVSAPFQN